ncbi:fasciclin domain-containing protein [Sphingopyxis macrogoltabida]|uniref:Beta-Ig-H3/fasciclin n=1 Tax=Sphingopyxis macrogoltabida TaxID=33050 RepID=A0AAC8Z0D2_SPHMC|nr:fasciclin domain-containing protein [Sphingopyxis macrogoltabida]ALJ13200.1 beta-Ig-H3/fasciclin [Sphingopyxis macrogoltabida]AMU89334.1 beta-Ig-H3/fasciclin [Sphingopyxis macrogoltabida]
MKSHFATALIAAGLGLAGCSSKSDPAPTEKQSVASQIAATVAADPNGTIADAVAASPTHRMLATVLQQAGLAATLSGTGPFTLFAPTDDAFIQVPPTTRDGWMLPAQKQVLTGILQYHIVPGKLTVADLSAKIAADGGKTLLKTASGEELTASLSGKAILLTSASGNRATVTAPDIQQANGVVHVIDAVLLPAM